MHPENLNQNTAIMPFEKKKKYSVINIPFEIQEKIIKSVVPVKSLIRFRTVSKQWKSLINNPEFIAHHALNMQTQPHHLLVRYIVDSEHKYVSVVDDDSFPRNMYYHTLPSICRKFSSEPLMIGSSHGLVGLLIYFGSYPLTTADQLVIWNPSIRKHVCIKLPDKASTSEFGFGVCPKTGDPKIVQISIKDWEAKVFSLSSRAWRSVSLNLPRRGSLYLDNQVVIGGVCYWSVYSGRHIISFDLTSEEFSELEFPEIPAVYDYTSISKFNDCLVVLYYSDDRVTGRKDCHVWKMLIDGASNYSFTKLFCLNIKASHDHYMGDRIVGFRMNGQLIIERYRERVLEVYDQQGSSKGYIDFGNRGHNLQMTSYMESLLLLKHDDSIIDS